MTIKSRFISLLSAGLLLLTQTAHADFRKALDAYIARDGATMLKEVKGAIKKNRDDGLLLFLMAIKKDENTTAIISFDNTYKNDTDPSKTLTTYKVILNEPELLEMKGLLNTAVKNSNADVRFYAQFVSFLSDKASKPSPQAILKKEEYLAKKNIQAARLMAGKNSYSGKADKLKYSKDKEAFWAEKAAILGDPEYALALAFRYLNYPVDNISPTQEECQLAKNHTFCLKKNEKKGVYWLKKAIKNSDVNRIYMRKTSFHIGSLLQDKVHDRASNLRQAYLWYLTGLNSPDFGHPSGLYTQGISISSFIAKLNNMHESGDLKTAAPELYAVWSDETKRNEILFPRALKKLPNLLIESRNLEPNTNLLFTYEHMNYSYYKLDVYEDGDVWLQMDTNGFKDKLMHMPASQLGEFMGKLELLGFGNWRLVNSNKVDRSYWCDSVHKCRSDDSLITVYQKTRQKTVYWGYDKHTLLSENLNASRIKDKGRVFALVEEYFPTQRIRCEVGNSKTYSQSCIQYDHSMMNGIMHLP